MRAHHFILFPVAVLISFTAAAQGVIRTVTFDSSNPQPGTGFGTTLYGEAGMVFTPVQTNGQFGRAGGGISGFPENGTDYVILGYTDTISGRRSDSGRFCLYSVDLSEFSTLYLTPKTVEFFGYLVDGSIVTQSFTTDGVIDGTGPLADFETFYFSSAFSDIIRFEVSDYGYAMDNLRYSQVVPEPCVPALLLLGLPLFRRLLRQRVLTA